MVKIAHRIALKCANSHIKIFFDIITEFVNSSLGALDGGCPDFTCRS